MLTINRFYLELLMGAGCLHRRNTKQPEPEQSREAAELKLPFQPQMSERIKAGAHCHSLLTRLLLLRPPMPAPLSAAARGVLVHCTPHLPPSHHWLTSSSFPLYCLLTLQISVSTSFPGTSLLTGQTGPGTATTCSHNPLHSYCHSPIIP